MSNKSRNRPVRRHVPAESSVVPVEHAEWESERESQRAREQAMAARTKSGRTQMPVGQGKVQRIYKGNQPKG